MKNLILFRKFKTVRVLNCEILNEKSEIFHKKFEIFHRKFQNFHKKFETFHEKFEIFHRKFENFQKICNFSCHIFTPQEIITCWNSLEFLRLQA